ncbi:hypothetical protein BDA99DRAFT_515574 [Phascolomyces articulosus]|uniref:Uncharacterized protein n=1 Tax=Phascolomyces articulosus TaxID=60185 RepID=A0AAD5PE25_9FUNG|nr:hypothetical protein BDA99DRAFT_515574 [Phascolomyces articulosus]
MEKSTISFISILFTRTVVPEIYFFFDRTKRVKNRNRAIHLYYLRYILNFASYVYHSNM